MSHKSHGAWTVRKMELAELQALNRVAMTMGDWLARLRDFLAMTGRGILEHAGSISREAPLEKAHEEYKIFKTRQLETPSEAERHFLDHAERGLRALEQRHANKKD